MKIKALCPDCGNRHQIELVVTSPPNFWKKYTLYPFQTIKAKTGEACPFCLRKKRRALLSSVKEKFNTHPRYSVVYKTAPTILHGHHLPGRARYFVLITDSNDVFNSYRICYVRLFDAKVSYSTFPTTYFSKRLAIQAVRKKAGAK